MPLVPNQTAVLRSTVVVDSTGSVTLNVRCVSAFDQRATIAPLQMTSQVVAPPAN